ncbi:MAG TPA: histidine kinase dimerization/phospho-acceptor domain-containing protein [Thermoanaerobaculia bacterium]|nr:histidine kinase dimerization/phospho-acceptor domain-containing protein [Thermoanaerobaculia bacterium]
MRTVSVKEGPAAEPAATTESGAGEAMRPASGSPDPGVAVIRDGAAVFVDARARELLGGAEDDLGPYLDAAGLCWDGSVPRSAAQGESASGNRLGLDFRADGAGGGVLLVTEGATAERAETDLRLISLMRSLTQITPAVAHDLRAPINAMVFNIEVLKETIASGRGADPGGQERQLRYVNVLKEELHRLHRGMETFISQISPRGDRDEILDLREPLEELADLLVGPARKQQARVEARLPAEKVLLHGNRYLLRQALLHLALAVLGTVPRDGVLEIGLQAAEGRARCRLAGAAGSVEGAGPEPVPSEARLRVARSILASQGGEVRPDPGEGPQAYEVEWLLQDTVSQEKE